MQDNFRNVATTFARRIQSCIEPPQSKITMSNRWLLAIPLYHRPFQRNPLQLFGLNTCSVQPRQPVFFTSEPSPEATRHQGWGHRVSKWLSSVGARLQVLPFGKGNTANEYKWSLIASGAFDKAAAPSRLWHCPWSSKNLTKLILARTM